MGGCWKSFQRSRTLEKVDPEKLVEGPPLGHLSRPGRLPGTETVEEVPVLVSLRIEFQVSNFVDNLDTAVLDRWLS